MDLLPQMNRLASLRLTERCADILVSVREEVIDAGYTVAEELNAPISKLNECDTTCSTSYLKSEPSFRRAFQGVLHFLTKMGRRPFLKRYLRRDEIAFTISSCDAALNDALGTFGVGLSLHSGAFQLTCLTLTAVNPNSHTQANPGQ
jgi:abelson tyrosine-protein kinase 1